MFYDEIDDVIATLNRNASGPLMMGLTNSDGIEAIREIVIPNEFDIDTFGLGEGYDVHKAEGYIQVRIVR